MLDLGSCIRRWTPAALLVAGVGVGMFAWAQDATVVAPAAPPSGFYGTLPDYLQVAGLAYIGGQARKAIEDLARAVEGLVAAGRQLATSIDGAVQAGVIHARAIDATLAQVARNLTSDPKP